MPCKIPVSDFCYFVGPCKYQSDSYRPSTAELHGTNVCYEMHANYNPLIDELGKQKYFTIDGQITPTLQNGYPDFIKFEVSGTRTPGAKTFYASGTIGKYFVERVRIDWKARPGSSDIVDVKVWLPCQALLANRKAK